VEHQVQFSGRSTAGPCLYQSVASLATSAGVHAGVDYQFYQAAVLSSGGRCENDRTEARLPVLLPMPAKFNAGNAGTGIVTAQVSDGKWELPLVSHLEGRGTMSLFFLATGTDTREL
jgi:hypothetical protein